MSIRCECIQCQKGIVVPDKYAGRSIRCPACQTAFTVPKQNEAATISIGSADRTLGAPLPSSTKGSSTGFAKTLSLGSLEEAERQSREAPKKSHSRSIRDEHVEEEEDLEWDITPMVDVGFLLLIFFMLTASFSVQKAIKTATKKDENTQSTVVKMEEPVDDVKVQVDELNGYRVVTADNDTHEASARNELLNILRDIKIDSGDKVPRVVVEAHVDSTHGAVVAVLDAAAQAGFPKFQMASVEGFD